MAGAPIQTNIAVSPCFNACCFIFCILSSGVLVDFPLVIRSFLLSFGLEIELAAFSDFILRGSCDSGEFGKFDDGDS